MEKVAKAEDKKNKNVSQRVSGNLGTRDRKKQITRKYIDIRREFYE